LGKLNILNRKEVKVILGLLDEQWGIREVLDFVFLMNDEDGVFVVSKDFACIDEKKLRVNSLGLYFGELRNDEFRLSIEGSQLLGRFADKGVLDISDEQVKEYVAGNDLLCDSKDKGFFLLRNGFDFFGAAKLKSGRIFNFFPKSRRVGVCQ
jgi:NOL1/NOP2/fmu family ribosome biogenesis protein